MTKKSHATWSRQQLMSPYHYQHTTFLHCLHEQCFLVFSLYIALSNSVLPPLFFPPSFAMTFTYHNLTQNSLSNGPNKGWLNCTFLEQWPQQGMVQWMLLISIRNNFCKTLIYLCLSHYIGTISVFRL